MKKLIWFLLAVPGLAQEVATQAPQQTPLPITSQDQPPANAAGQSRDQSVIKPKPAGEVIKPKDY